eukprot:1141723-Amorphochlora_amoeboformis.AAC.3
MPLFNTTGNYNKFQEGILYNSLKIDATQVSSCSPPRFLMAEISQPPPCVIRYGANLGNALMSLSLEC